MPEIVGRYELGEQIASDALCRTHRAVRAHTREVVHVRVAALPELGALRESFERSAAAAARLSHDNVLPQLDSGLHEGAPYTVHEPIAGTTLRELLAREPGGRLQAEHVATIGLDVVRALAHAHAVEVLHRALSPDAIEIDSIGVSRVVSFALPALLAEAATTHAHLLEHVGRYGSPEQAQQRGATAASDVFALGATLYEALAGTPAFDAITPAAAVAKVSAGTHVSIDVVAPAAPSELRALITRMLATSAPDRPSTREVASVLEALAGDARSIRLELGQRGKPPREPSPAACTPRLGAALASPSAPSVPWLTGAPAPRASAPAAGVPWLTGAPTAPASTSSPTPAAAPPMAPSPEPPRPPASPPIAPSPAPPRPPAPASPFPASAPAPARAEPPLLGSPAPPRASPRPLDPPQAPALVDGTLDDLPTEQTRFDAVPVGPAPPPAPVPEPVRARTHEPPPVRAADPFDAEEPTDLPGEATTWDTRVPDDAPIDATSPQIGLPPDPGDDARSRPLVVEKTVQIAMPAAAAAMFHEGRPTYPVDAAAAAAASARAAGRRETQPIDPAVLSSAAEAADFRSPYSASSPLLFVAIGVGAIGAVALVAVLAMWLAQ